MEIDTLARYVARLAEFNRNKVMTPPNRTGLSTIDEVIADAKAGKLFILVDDEDRENEGDLCVIGEYATAESINFMAKWPWVNLPRADTAPHRTACPIYDGTTQ